MVDSPADAWRCVRPLFQCSVPDSLLCSLMGVFQQRRIFVRRGGRALVSSLTCVRSVTYGVGAESGRLPRAYAEACQYLGSSASSDRAASTDFVDPSRHQATHFGESRFDT